MEVDGCVSERTAEVRDFNGNKNKRHDTMSTKIVSGQHNDWKDTMHRVKSNQQGLRLRNVQPWDFLPGRSRNGRQQQREHPRRMV